jgi:hypothetical protein
MVFEKDLKCILEKYEGRIITKELIGKIVDEYRKMFICPSWADDIDKYYTTEKKDDDPSN